MSLRESRRLRTYAVLGLAPLLLAFGLAATNAPRPEDSAAQTRASSSVQPRPAVVTSFTTIDLFADADDEHLAAYQVEVTLQPPMGTQYSLVGVEGGEVRPFVEPPMYDPDALSHNRVVIAAFTPPGADQLPTGRFRIARLHVEVQVQAGREAVQPGAEPHAVIAASACRVRVIAAGRVDGSRVPASFDAVPGVIK